VKQRQGTPQAKRAWSEVGMFEDISSAIENINVATLVACYYSNLIINFGC
jgi:hypothetical protein